MWNFHHNPICRNFHTVFFLILSVFLLSSLIVISASTIHASSGPFDSGYDHGCNDATILDPSERYINQPEKGPSFHTDEFMQGYYDGYDACRKQTAKAPNESTYRSIARSIGLAAAVANANCPPPDTVAIRGGFSWIRSPRHFRLWKHTLRRES